MTDPQDIDFVAEPVGPVISEVAEHKGANPNAPLGIKDPGAPTCCHVKYGGIRADGDDLGKQGTRLVHDAAPDVGHAVAQAVEPLAFQFVPCDFQPDEGEEDGNGQHDEIHGY